VTPKPVSIHPAALAEAEAAVEWYRARSERAAQRFIHEITEAVHRIAIGTDQFSLSELGIRRMLLRRFPYLVVFREGPSAIEVIAIAHGYRAPGYWKNRVQ
jgi:toxin ParE1/3/4